MKNRRNSPVHTFSLLIAVISFLLLFSCSERKGDSVSTYASIPFLDYYPTPFLPQKPLDRSSGNSELGHLLIPSWFTEWRDELSAQSHEMQLAMQLEYSGNAMMRYRERLGIIYNEIAASASEAGKLEESLATEERKYEDALKEFLEDKNPSPQNRVSESAAESHSENSIQVDSKRDGLFGILEKKKQRVAESDEGYFAAGSESELIRDGLLKKEVRIVNNPEQRIKIIANPDLSKMIEVNKNTTSYFPVFAKEAVLLTMHPAGSYTWQLDDEGNIRFITIDDPHTFWKYENKLVILTR